MERLLSYFSDGIRSKTLEKVGMEVETQFVDKNGDPISTAISQAIFGKLTDDGWRVDTRKNGLISSLVDNFGNTFSYELGRHNIELSGAATSPEKVIRNTEKCLGQLYKAGEKFGALPLFEPILYGEEDLLVIPDERDAVWLELDGRSNLAPLARTSSVQFTISVDLDSAVRVLNKLGENIDVFLEDYPQETIWKKYIQNSLARYRPDRYGGPLLFDSLGDYCEKIVKNDVVVGTTLVPYKNVGNLDIPLYLRSVWWYFRLKRYGDDLCIEVRPMPRRRDGLFDLQLKNVLDIVGS